MSGFFALRSFGSAADPQVLEEVAGAASHRGRPRAWSEDGVALVVFDAGGREGLAVTDGLVVAFDGRLHETAGITGPSDTERFAEAWRRWGPAAADRLVGDFAAAVWDRHARELWVVRDPSAGRPALVGVARDRLIAGSSIAMLLADPAIERVIDDGWVASYLANVPAFETASGYRSIERLPPGHGARATPGGWRRRRVASWRVRSVRERDPAAYAEGFRARFDEAVRCRTEGAARVGIALSGGLDSTSVAVTARAVRPELDLVALCMPFEGAGDETGLQRLVAGRIGAPIAWVPLDGASPFGAGPDALFDTYGTPPVAPNLFHVEALADAGRAAGIEVALDGIDGDSLVGGNPAFLADLLVRGRWRALLAEARAYRDVHGVGRRWLLRTHAVEPLLPTALVRAARRRGNGLPPWLDRSFARRMHLERQVAAEPWRPGRSFVARQMMALGPAIAPLMLELIDEAWARRGIEVAHPFGDRRLVEYCLGLPRDQKVVRGITKVVLRAAMRGLLPPEVAERPDKANLSAPFRAGLSGSSRPLVEQGLRAASSNPAPWLDPEEVGRLGERFADGRDLFDAFRVAALGHWARWLTTGTIVGRRTHHVRDRRGTWMEGNGTRRRT